MFQSPSYTITNYTRYKMETNNENKPNLEDVFKSLYNSKYLKDYAKRIAVNEWEELFSECISIILEKGEEKLYEIIEGGYLHQYMFMTMRNQISIKNKTTFRKKFRNDEVITDFMSIKLNDFDDNDYNNEELTNDVFPFNKNEYLVIEEQEEYNKTLMYCELLEYIEDIIAKDSFDNKNTYFYHSKLLKYMVDEKINAWQLSKKIGIPYSSVRHSLAVYREYLSKLEKEFIENYEQQK